MAKEESPEPPAQPCGQGCISRLSRHHPSSTAKAGLKEGLPAGTAQLGKHSCLTGQLKQLLPHLSPWITEKEALQLEENSKL